jgi:hypothetical protein
LQKRHLIVRTVCALALLTSCTTEPPTAVQSDAVTMGALDPADPATVALVAAPISCGDPLRVLCSGTLIAPRVVLTAAHCVTALPAADTLVFFGTDVASGQSVLVAVDHVLAHPDYAAPENDVGVVVLAEPAPATITPAPLPTTALGPADVGAQVRIAGFGFDELGGLGVKRAGTASITQVHARDFVIGAAPAMSCDGDSGGPVFITRDAIEEVAGITAFGDARCTLSGTNMRVDAYDTSFIAPNLTASPPARPALDPSADFCAAACSGDADCPLGMGCVPNPAGGMACGLRGLPPGQLGGACGAGGECASGMCLTVGTSCLCYAPCAAPMPPGDGDGGCAVAPHRSAAGDALLLLVIACGSLRRAAATCRRRSART